MVRPVAASSLAVSGEKRSFSRNFAFLYKDILFWDILQPDLFPNCEAA